MAEKTITFKLKWENQKEFAFTCDNGEADVTVVKVEENGHIALLWHHVETICTTFFQEKIAEVGKEMKE